MFSSPMIKQALTFIALLSCLNAWAYYPFITDDTGTQGLGGNQIETAYEFAKVHNDVLNEEGKTIGTAVGTTNIFAMTYTRGVGDKVDIFLSGSRQLSPVNGWQNSEIGLKWSFAGNQNKGWSAAIKPSVILPVSLSMQNSGLGNAKTNLSILLIGSYLADEYELHLNTGYTSNNRATTQDDDPQRRNLWVVSISPVFNLNDQWKLGVDAGFQTNPAYNSNYQAFGGIGAVYSPIEKLQIGFGLYAIPTINSNDNGWAYTLSTGITYQF